MKINWNYKKIILFSFFLIISFGFFGVSKANAGFFSWLGSSISWVVNLGGITSGVIYYAAMGIAYLLGYIASGVLYLAGWLVDFTLQINLQLLNSPIIQTGWKIILAFTNLGFVLAIIVIAFATIFRSETYAMKQTLWKLIVAALLVNFSLVIAGGILDISHRLTAVFLDKINEGGSFGSSLSTSMASVLKAQMFLSGTEIERNTSSTPYTQNSNITNYSQNECTTDKGCTWDGNNNRCVCLNNKK